MRTRLPCRFRSRVVFFQGLLTKVGRRHDQRYEFILCNDMLVYGGAGAWRTACTLHRLPLTGHSCALAQPRSSCPKVGATGPTRCCPSTKSSAWWCVCARGRPRAARVGCDSPPRDQDLPDLQRRGSAPSLAPVHEDGGLAVLPASREGLRNRIQVGDQRASPRLCGLTQRPRHACRSSRRRSRSWSTLSTSMRRRARTDLQAHQAPHHRSLTPNS